MALAADLRLAPKGPAKFGLPEVALGVLPGTGGTQRLARLVGKARAIELIATGRTFDVEQACRLGIVDRVFDGDDFFGQVMTYARQFLPPQKANRAVGLIKRSIQSGLEMSFHDALALERELQQQLFATDDAREGLEAYIAKRKPVFRGH